MLHHVFAALIEWLWLAQADQTGNDSRSNDPLRGLAGAHSGPASPRPGRHLPGASHSPCSARLQRARHGAEPEGIRGRRQSGSKHRRWNGCLPTADRRLFLAGIVLLACGGNTSPTRSAIRTSPWMRPREMASRLAVVLANGTMGMALGVSCVQWALKTTPTGITQSVLAITPLMVIPLAWRFEGEKPRAVHSSAASSRCGHHPARVGAPQTVTVELQPLSSKLPLSLNERTTLRQAAV